MKSSFGRTARHRLNTSRERRSLSVTLASSPTPLAEIPTYAPNSGTIHALYAIKTTPFKSSFASRSLGLELGTTIGNESVLVAMDWETRTEWMELMEDIREHYRLRCPDREPASYVYAPIAYTTLRPTHLDQVHDILSRVFWDGIDGKRSRRGVHSLFHFLNFAVSEFLPAANTHLNKYTMVACYKHLVVGLALFVPTSPQEVYITYVAVRAGWEGSGIATYAFHHALSAGFPSGGRLIKLGSCARSMLFHLISQNPDQDITLHVSAKNPAMLLYNRLGFKAEEFIVGFYDAYMDAKSKGSKNAVRLRLRRVG